MERLPSRPDAERFVWLLVGGGLALVAGLWLAALSTIGTTAWLLGAGLAGAGVAGLGAGIAVEIEP